MNKKQYYLLIIGILTAFIIFVGFWIKEYKKSDAMNSNKSYTVSIIVKSLNRDTNFWNNVRYGVDIASEELSINYNLSAPQSEIDVEGQIKLVEKAIEDKPDAIIIAACDFNRLAPICQKATDEGILVVSLDSDVNLNTRRTFVGTDSYEMGKQLADLVNESLGENEKFAVESYVRGTTTEEQRLTGLLENVSDCDKRLATISYCEGDENLAQMQVMEMLESDPSIKCVVGLNENSSRGIANAIFALGLYDDINVFTCDISEQQITYLEDGTIDASVVQNPCIMGYLSVVKTIDILNNKHVDRQVFTECKTVKKSDLNRPDYQQLIMPFEEK